MITRWSDADRHWSEPRRMSQTAEVQTYWPKEELLEGRWVPPPVVPIE